MSQGNETELRKTYHKNELNIKLNDEFKFPFLRSQLLSCLLTTYGKLTII